MNNIKYGKRNNKLPKNSQTDILIIGGGITGLTTAYFLKDTSKKIMVVDKGTIGTGITSKSTAKITYLQGIIYQQLEKNFGLEMARCYFDSQKEAIARILEIIKQEKISCDLEQVDSIIFTLKNSGISKIKKEEAILKEFGVTTKEIDSNDIVFGIKVSDSYVFHPVKYLLELKNLIEKKISIYENILVNKIKKSTDGYFVFTSGGVVEAKKVVIACHYPFFLKPLFTPLKTYIKREYVNAAKIDDPCSYSAISIDNELHSIRYYKNYVLYGSNQHKLTSKIAYDKNYKQSRKDFRRYFHRDPEFTWMNQDMVSHDMLPFIGKVQDGLYVAMAYYGWGMTNGTIAGKIISDLIMTGSSPYQKLFYPYRFNLSLFGNSILGTFHYMKAYTQSLWKKSNPSYIKIHGVMYATYLDDKKMPHTLCLLCPHMKCNLVFNKEEKTWDCPCHGSRFTLDGDVIEGPAKEPLKKK